MSVSDGLFGEIIVEDDGVFTVVTEPFSHGATRVWSKVLKWCGVSSGGNDNNGVFHGTGSLQTGNKLGNSRLFLSDSDVDAVPIDAMAHYIAQRGLYDDLQLLTLVFSGVELSLVQHGVEGDSGLTSLSISNDQLSLTTTNWDKGVNGLKTSLHRLVDRFTGDNA